MYCGAGSCPLVYAAVIDTSHSLSHEGLDHRDSRACGADLIGTCTYELSMRPRWFDVLLRFRQGLADASCVAFHLPRGDEWRCADGDHLLEHHVLTPFFVRVDLQDRLVMGNALETGFAYQWPSAPKNRGSRRRSSRPAYSGRNAATTRRYAPTRQPSGVPSRPPTASFTPRWTYWPIG